MTDAVFRRIRAREFLVQQPSAFVGGMCQVFPVCLERAVEERPNYLADALQPQVETIRRLRDVGFLFSFAVSLTLRSSSFEHRTENRSTDGENEHDDADYSRH